MGFVVTSQKPIDEGLEHLLEYVEAAEHNGLFGVGRHHLDLEHEGWRVSTPSFSVYRFIGESAEAMVAVEV